MGKAWHPPLKLIKEKVILNPKMAMNMVDSAFESWSIILLKYHTMVRWSMNHLGSKSGNSGNCVSKTSTTQIYGCWGKTTKCNGCKREVHDNACIFGWRKVLGGALRKQSKWYPKVYSYWKNDVQNGRTHN